MDNLEMWRKYSDRVMSLQQEIYNIDVKPKYVYIIQLGDTDVFKIGYSHDPNNRLKQIQHRSQIPLKIIFSWLGCDYKAFEYMLHFKYRKQRVKNEWFKLSQEDLMWLADTYPNLSKYDMTYEFCGKN